MALIFLAPYTYADQQQNQKDATAIVKNINDSLDEILDFIDTLPEEERTMIIMVIYIKLKNTHKALRYLNPLLYDKE